MASTFVLAFALGASGALGGNPITDAFGVIALIAMTPIIAIQALGILVTRAGNRKTLSPENAPPGAMPESPSGNSQSETQTASLEDNA